VALYTFVQRIWSIFRPPRPADSEPEPGTIGETANTGAGRWIWPFRLRIFGVRPPAEEREAPTNPLVELPDWNGILDTLFWSGYTGTGAPDETLDRLEGLQAAALSATREEFDVRQKVLAAKADALSSERVDDRAEEPVVRARIAELETAREGTAAGVASTADRLLGAHARLVSRRQDFAQRQIEERIRVEAALSQDLAATVAHTESLRTGAEAALLERERLRRERAGPAYTEWQAAYDQRVCAVRTQADTQGRVVATLRASGMTERVTGFFVWAGYLGMLVFGWRLGDVLQTKLYPNAASLSGMVTLLTRTAYGTFLRVGTERSLWWVLALTALWMAGSYGIFYLYDQGMQHFDTAWKPDSTPVSGRGSTSADGEGISYRSMLAALTGGTITRTDYRHFLARTPLLAVPVLLGALGLIFIAMGNQEFASPGEFVDPGTGLLFLAFGFALAAMVTGLLALVLQPMIARRAAQNGGPSGWAPALSVALLVAVLGGAVALSVDVGPAINPWGATSLGGPLALVLANGVMLSHGLVYRHVFRDWRALRKEVARLETEHGERNPYRILRGKAYEPESLVWRWNELHRELRDAWSAQDAAAGDPLEVSRLTVVTQPVGEDGKAIAAPTAADPVLSMTTVTVRDGRMEPDLASEVARARADYAAARARQDDVERRLADARARLEEIEGTRLDERWAELQAELRRLGTERTLAEAEVEVRYMALRQEGVSAYEGGRQLADRLSRVTSSTLRL
jgi:hypothetical protein